MIQKAEIIDQKIRVTQVKSAIKLTKKQKSSLLGLGLGKVGSEIVVDCSQDIFGMIKSISHLLTISKS